jgi:hypothetical protein
MRYFLAITISIFLNACAIDTGVVPLSSNTFTITKQASTGFPGIDGVKEGVLQDANKYCANTHQLLKILSTSETKPPYIFGNFPKAEMTFSCESISE